ncbi:helix-turn-helix domain-containing protein, partial [Alkalithermobacter thermoalcaliphilus]
MIKTYKVKLLPNNKQRTKLFECASVARWAYNFALATQQE